MTRAKKTTKKQRPSFAGSMTGTIKVPFDSPLDGLLVLAFNKQKAITLKGVRVLSSQSFRGIDGRYFDLSIDTGELQ